MLGGDRGLAKAHLRALPDQPIPAIGSIRVSHAREEMISPDLQRGAISRWAKENHREIVLWLEDLDATGREFAKRKIGEGIAMIEAGTAKEILVYRYDRWGRNAADSLANIARAEIAGGAVRSVTEPFDAETAVGKYTRTNALALAEMQSDIIGENWRAALGHRRERGLGSGQPKFGYTYCARKAGGDGLYHPDPVTGPLLASLYRRYIGGAKMGTLASELSRAGYRTSKGKPWSQDSLRGMLDSGFGAGLLIAGNFRPAGTRRKVPTFTEGTHEPVIDQATWAEYRARRGEVLALPPAERAATYALTGLLVHAECGGGCVHTSNRPPYAGRTIGCSRHRRFKNCVPLYRDRRRVEAEVRAWVAQVAAGRNLSGHFDRAREIERAKADLALIEAERKDITRQLVRAQDGWLREVLNDEEFRAIRTELAHRDADLEQAEQAALAPPRKAPRQALGALLEAWDDLPTEALNAALREGIGAVLLTADRVIVIGRWELRS